MSPQSNAVSQGAQSAASLQYIPGEQLLFPPRLTNCRSHGWHGAGSGKEGIPERVWKNASGVKRVNPASLRLVLPTCFAGSSKSVKSDVNRDISSAAFSTIC